MDRLPRELKCLIAAKVGSARSLRTSSRGLQGVVEDCTTSLKFSCWEPTTGALLSLLQRTPLLASLTVRCWWPNMHWATALAACPGLQSLDLTGCERVSDLSALAACPGWPSPSVLDAFFCWS
jgi:hypothetical protein